MRASAEPTLRQDVVVAVFDRVDALRACLDAMRRRGVPAEGLTLIAHEQLASGAPGDATEAGHPLAHEALIGGILGGYLAGWGGLALVSIPDFGPAVVAGGARAVVAERLADALTAPAPVDHVRAALLAALRSGCWLLVAHGDAALLTEADACLRAHSASRVERLVA